MTPEELLRRLGNMQQMAYIRPAVYQEGRAKQLGVYEVKNGPMRFRVMQDKCMDIEELSYKGITFDFLSKPGLQGRGHYDTNGQEALRSIMGGLFFTAGLENICPPCTIDGKDYPMHGRIRTTPAEHLCADAGWKDGAYLLSCQGEMREGELFGENLVLRRTIQTKLGEHSLTVTDTIENQGFRPEPMMILYHINLGYPFLDEGTQIYMNTRSVIPRDETSRGHETHWNVMPAPKDNEPEYVFLHELSQTPQGTGLVVAWNPKLRLGLQLEYTKQNLPYFMQWKSIASGDYVMGLEPANSLVYGRAYHHQRGDVHMLAPLASETNVLTFTILDGEEERNQALTRLQEP